MTQPEQPRSGGFALLLAFVGGALVGGVAALLLAPRSGADTRRRLAGAVDGTRDLASRLPTVLREASKAAQGAFAAALNEGAQKDPGVSPRSGPSPGRRE